MKLIITAVFVALSSLAFGQSYTYEIGLKDMSDANNLKSASYLLSQIFDVAPEYNPSTEIFFVRSDVHVEESELEEKCAYYGFTLQLFSKNQYLPETPQNK